MQVDRVRRFGVDDSMIAQIVAHAARFSKTQILGNSRLDCKEHWIPCSGCPWYDCRFAETHTEMDCDPAVWSRVETPSSWPRRARNKVEFMATSEPTSRTLLERNTIRFLCSVLIKGGTRGEICRLLDPSDFQDPLRRVVFEEIRQLGSIDSRRLRELLPARVTTRGFPDFDLHAFLAPHEVSEKEIDLLFESALQLLDLSHPGEEDLGD